MRTNVIIALILIAAGVVGILIDTIGITTEQTTIDAGPVRVEAEQTEQMPIPLYAGIAAVIIGAGILLFGRKSN